MVNQQTATNTFCTAKWIVSATASQGTHTTIQAAINSASSGDTIFIRPGTYTENLTLKAGVSLTAYTVNSLTSTVTIIGKATFTAAGTVGITGIKLQTNSDFFLAITGSAASVVYIKDCFLNCSNNTGISHTSSSSSSAIQIYNSIGDIGTTGIGLFASTSAGSILIAWSNIGNSGSTLTASTITTGALGIIGGQLLFNITTSSTSAFTAYNSFIGATLNATSLTVGGSGENSATFCAFFGGTSSAISVGSTLVLNQCRVDSSNTNAITGAGSLSYGGITFGSSSSKINTSTLVALPMDTPSISFDGGTNFLANYTVGTWVPGISFGGGTTGITYTVQTGYYTRIGNIVIAGFQVNLSNKGSSTGNANITGLPVTSGANGANFTASIAYGALTLTALYTQAYVRTQNATNSLDVTQAGSAQNYAFTTNTNFANTTSLSGTIIYTTA